MKRLLSVVLAIALVTVLAGAAVAFMGPGGRPVGMDGGMMGMGPGHGAWGCRSRTSGLPRYDGTGPAATPAQNASATAVDFPDIKDSFHQLEASLRCFLRKDLTVKLAYLFERFTQTDFRTDGLVPFPNAAQPDIFLGNDLKDYTAHIVSVIIGYRF